MAAWDPIWRMKLLNGTCIGGYKFSGLKSRVGGSPISWMGSFRGIPQGISVWFLFFLIWCHFIRVFLFFFFRGGGGDTKRKTEAIWGGPRRKGQTHSGLKLDCCWVGSLDFNIWGNQVGFSIKPGASETFRGGANGNNQVPQQCPFTVSFLVGTVPLVQ